MAASARVGLLAYLCAGISSRVSSTTSGKTYLRAGPAGVDLSMMPEAGSTGPGRWDLPRVRKSGRSEVSGSNPGASEGILQ